MRVTIYSGNMEELTTTANVIKEALLEALEREGLLKKPASEIGATYAVILHKRGWFGNLWNKFFGDIEQTAFKVTVVKSA